MERLDARAAPLSPGSCISSRMLAPALCHGCGPLPLDPDPDLDLLLCPGKGLEMLWQKKEDSPGRSEKPPGCIVTKSLGAASGPFLVFGNCFGDSHILMRNVF